MNLGRLALKAVTNLRTWKGISIVMAFLTGLMFMATSGQTELSTGYVKGRDVGRLLEVATSLQAVNQVTDLSSAQKTVHEVQASIKKRTPDATILAFLSPLATGIDHFESVRVSGKADEATTILRSEVAPSATGFLKTVTDLNQKIDKQASERTDFRQFLKWTFMALFILSLLSLVSLLGEWMNGDMGDTEKWRLEILQQRLHYPFLPAVSEYLAKKAGVDEDKEIGERLAFMHMLTIFVPNVDSLSRDHKIFDPESTDLGFELKGAEFFASILSSDRSKFQLPPDGAGDVSAHRGTLAHALIHWMNQIHQDQKIDHFDAESEWDGQQWKFTLHTSGEPVHESIVAGYRDVMAKPAGVDRKNNNELDFVRAVLRNAASDVSVNHDNGNLNLVVTFTPQKH